MHLLQCISCIHNKCPNELQFLESMRQRLQYFDGFGCPLLLTSEYCNREGMKGTTEDDKDPQWKYVISDCGLDLENLPFNHSVGGIRNKFNANLNNKGIVTLSLISLLVTLPYAHIDNHLRNFCVINPYWQYDYKWTIKMSNNVFFELSWTAFGVFTMIDWDTQDVSCVISTITTSHFNIPQNQFTRGFQRMYPGGEVGAILLLQAIVKNIDNSLFSMRCLDISSGSSSFPDKFSSILEVVPCPIVQDVPKHIEHQIGLISRNLTKHGKKLLEGKKTIEDYHEMFFELYDRFVSIHNSVVIWLQQILFH